jgi:NADPH:quinone reductase
VEWGRQYDGGYAEYTLVPAENVIPITNTSNLPWETLAAIPETFLTAWGSLVEAMDVKSGQTLLVRGGSSSVGMAAISIAKQLGLIVVATTRNKNKIDALPNNDADYVVIDNGQIASQVRQLFPSDNGVNCVLELIGTVTLLDSIQAAAPKGIVCNTGILGNEWVINSGNCFNGGIRCHFIIDFIMLDLHITQPLVVNFRASDCNDKMTINCHIEAFNGNKTLYAMRNSILCS